MPIIPNTTLSSIINLANRANSDSVVQPPLPHGSFALDASGVASFFGGDTAVRAMATVYFIPQRRWLGWYNTPGAYEVAKQYSGIAKSYIFDNLFPTGDSDPAKILTVVDRQVNPEYTPLYSPTGKTPPVIGNLGSLILRKVSQIPLATVIQPGMTHLTKTRVTFVKLNRVPEELEELEPFPSSESSITLAGIGTILVSVGGCILCALVADWFCLASIALGIIANGVACSVIGSGKLYLKHNRTVPSEVYVPGDVLLQTDTEIIVVIGNGGSVAPFTRGRFLLRFGGTETQVQSSHAIHKAVACRSHGIGATHIATCPVCNAQHTIHITPASNSPASAPTISRPWIIRKSLLDISIILLLSQFLAQLLLIPQGTLFGQLMFIGTLMSSWMYQLYLSSLRLDLQTRALIHMLAIQEKGEIYRYQFNTWMEAVVFTCLAFREIHPDMSLPMTAEEINAAREGGEEGTAAAQGAVEDPKDKLKEAMAEEQRFYAVQKAKESKKEKDAFRVLLHALLPDTTDVWIAFKESLERKLGATDDGEGQIDLAIKESFNFNFRDSLAYIEDASGRSGILRRVCGKDEKQLVVYQEDAENALNAWRSVREIASLLRNRE